MDNNKHRNRFYSQQFKDPFLKKSRIKPLTPIIANLELDIKDIEEMEEIELAPSTHFDSLKNDFDDDFEMAVTKFEKKRSYSYQQGMTIDFNGIEEFLEKSQKR